jgi:hypothetical protein
MSWQRLVVRYALATVPAPRSELGFSLAFNTVVLRLARQQGKTYLARRFMLWRLMEGGRVFGQPQRLINTHTDSVQAIRLMEPVARQWGYGRGGLPGLTAQTFMAEWYPGGVEDEHGEAWFARSMTTRALTGNQGITFAYVDELQDAKLFQVQEALGGSLSGSRVVARQRWFTGTGEKPGSELLRRLRKQIGRPGVAWIEWSAPPGTSVSDEDGWRWASPDWSEERAAYLRDQVVDLPGDAFAANYLLSDVALTVAHWLPAEVVSACGVGSVVPGGRVAGVEQSRDGLFSAAFGGVGGVETLVRVDKANVVGWLATRSPEVVLCHQAVANQLPEGLVLRVVKSGEWSAAVHVLAESVASGMLRFDNPAAVGRAFADVVIAAGESGLRISAAQSRGDVSIVKALSWVVWSASQHPVEVAAIF